ncbi:MULTISPECIES: nuclease-related domain-containing DEAD/DEAH box helicase [unclassified Myroides]|uniref:nuclease-related domain-containing DEAD/DEAH box helicase n=1 Tax=unclassified Myroides TaxID=2642485 RepID=UPI003101656E
MAVQFFPSYPIQFIEENIFSSTEVGNKGEWLIYRELLQQLQQSKENWQVWFSYDVAVTDDFEELEKVEGEVDFIIIGKRGIIVLEVKGGNIKIENNQFYCKGNGDWTKITNPFRQASQHKHILRKQFLQQYGNILICDAVAFPSVNIRFEHPRFDDKLIYSKYKKGFIYNNIENFLNSVYDRHIEKLSQAHSFDFTPVSNLLMASISNILNVNIEDKNVLKGFDTLEWLQIDSIGVLEALEDNSRLMIQGDPGTGKTTLALAFADLNKDLNGLYLCWTHFLRLHNEERFKARGINIDVLNYFDFVVAHCPNLTKQECYGFSSEEFSLKAREAIVSYLEKGGKRYDYIIIDEAQDLFDRNLDVFLDKMCVTGDGLKRGRSLVLYDFKQSFNQGEGDVREYAYLLKDYYAHYRLRKSRRNIAEGEINQLALDVKYNPEDILDVSYYSRKQQVSLNVVRGKKEFQKAIKRYVTSIQDPKSSLRAKDIIVLVQASIINRREDICQIIEECGVTFLTDENFTIDELNYTTPIKFKGLERKHIVLIVDKPNRASNYEWYMGVTRAVESVELIKIEFKK